jgi:hypothetical protein
MRAYFRPANQPYTRCNHCDGKGYIYVKEGQHIRRKECRCENGLIPVSSADTTNHASNQSKPYSKNHAKQSE